MIVRYIAGAYGYTPEQIASLPDDVLYDLIPGLAEADLRQKAKEDKQRLVEWATEVWKKDNPGIEPDYKRDLVPIINAR